MAIRRRGPNTYQIVIELGTDPAGKRKRYFETFKGKRREAEQRERELLQQFNLGVLEVPERVTVEEFFRDWLKEKAKTVRRSTYLLYEETIGLYVIPHLGRLELPDLKAQHLVRLYDHLSERGLTNRTVRYVHMLVRQALDRAVQWNLVPQNVANRVKPPKRERPAFRVWNEEEIRRFLLSARSSTYYELYHVALMTGMRIGELLGLRWANVDFEARRIYVVEQYSERTESFEDLKTSGSRRYIALDHETVNVLRERRKKQNAQRLKAVYWEDLDLVFSTRNGLPLSGRNIRRDFRAVIARAGVPEIRFHDLRHTHATFLLTRGWHPKVVQERLGHSSIQITLDTYSHVLPSLQDRLVDATLGISLYDVKMAANDQKKDHTPSGHGLQSQ